ncbi:MAG: porin family protein [Hyphomonadaceae bacterium]|jgi:outer membrane immunogenic protein|nr:porin family protein [Hyphomonadaceae bacterium]
MRKVRSALVALTATALVLVGAGSAGANGPRSIKDSPYGGANWAGFYVGVQGGYGWGDTQHFAPASGVRTGTQDINGGLFGATWGTNWQRGHWVYGFESDVSFSSLDGTFTAAPCGASGCTTDLRNLSTSRVRLGYAMDNRLLYVTGGLAYGNVRAGDSTVRDDETRFGWALGAGIEWAFAPKWSLKAEYLRVDLGDSSLYTNIVPVHVDLTADIVRVGVNYNLGPDFWSNMLGRR